MLRSPGTGTAVRDEEAGIAANEGDSVGRYEAISGKNGFFARLGVLGRGRMESRTASVEEFGRYHWVCKGECHFHIPQRPCFLETGRNCRINAAARLFCPATLTGVTNCE